MTVAQPVSQVLPGHLHTNQFSFQNVTFLIRFHNVFRPHYDVLESLLPSTSNRETGKKVLFYI